MTGPLPQLARKTVWQQNVTEFAGHPETHIDMERRASVRSAAALIADGQSHKALHDLARSVERQNRIAGGGSVVLHPTCPCGGRCPNGVLP